MLFRLVYIMYHEGNQARSSSDELFECLDDLQK
jgi:hypothetical protein